MKLIEDRYDSIKDVIWALGVSGLRSNEQAALLLAWALPGKPVPPVPALRSLFKS